MAYTGKTLILPKTATMTINPSDVTFFEAVYHNGTTPPPYNYEYRLQLSLAGRGDIKTKYDLVYRFRDELTEEEIMEEGFTADDDYSWEGRIPPIWRKELATMLSKTSWPKDQKLAARTEPYIRLFMKMKDGSTHKAIPAETDAWDYFLQEMVQGIYELAQKERFLEINFLEIAPGQGTEEVILKPVFHLRNAQVYIKKEKAGGKKENISREIPWEKVKSTLRQVYIPDYDYEQASPKRPSKPGKYIQTGEGLWFKLGESATNPDPDRDALSDMETALKGV